MLLICSDGLYIYLVYAFKLHISVMLQLLSLSFEKKYIHEFMDLRLLCFIESSRYGFELDRTPVKNCEHLKFGCDAYWHCAIRHDTAPENHQAGSCKMGSADDPLAVVDSQLRVRGVRGVRVADTSIMPRVTSGNTNAPAIMIGM